MKVILAPSLSALPPKKDDAKAKKPGDKKSGGKAKQLQTPKVFKPDPSASRDREVFAFVSEVLKRPISQANIGRFKLKRLKDGLAFVDQGGSAYPVPNTLIGSKLSNIGMYGQDFIDWLYDKGIE